MSNLGPFFLKEKERNVTRYFTMREYDVDVNGKGVRICVNVD